MAMTLFARAVGEKHAAEVAGHLTFFHEIVTAEPWLKAEPLSTLIPYYALKVLQRPRIARPSSVIGYLESLCHVWPKLGSTATVVAYRTALGATRPLRPTPRQSTVADACWTTAIDTLAAGARYCLTGARLLVHALLLNGGMRSIDATRFLMKGGIAIVTAAPTTDPTVFVIRFRLTRSKSDVAGATTAPSDNPFVVHRSYLPFVALALGTAMQPAEAIGFHRMASDFWHAFGVADILSFRRATASSLANMTKLDDRPLDPGMAHALVQARLTHKPGSAVTRRYTHFEVDAPMTLRAISAAIDRAVRPS
jgi:hypothetical protein